MNVGELRAKLADYPDDLPVMVINDLDDSVDEADCDVAINHPGVRPKGRKDWTWEQHAERDGVHRFAASVKRRVLVFY